MKLRGIPVENWNAQYASGSRDPVISPGERQRYMVIAGLIDKLGSAPEVLDLGCGTGLLHQALRGRPLGSYTGIDLSSKAIELAQPHTDERSRFLTCDIRVWEPPGQYDAIVFNEVLYYLERPLTVVQRYISHLTPNGAIIVSIYHPRSLARLPLRIRLRRIERAIRRQFTVAHSLWIQNEQAQLSWRISVLEPRHTSAKTR